MSLIEHFKNHFTYNILTGELRWKIAARNRPIESIAGLNRRDIKIKGIYYTKSKICWALHYGEYPTETLDHKDIDWNNNKITNLRKATGSQNQYNKVQSNPSGYKGVTWRSRINKPWLAKIRVNRTRINLGSFATAEEAAEVYKKACLKYHGEFANLGVR